MSKVKDTKNKLKSKLESIKKINDDPQGLVDSLYDKYLNDLPSTDQLFGKKLDDFLEKRKKKKDNNKDIFSELLEVAEGFLSVNKKVEGSDRLFSKSRLKQHSLTATKKTLDESKQIITDSVNKIFFTGDGVCGANKSITGDTITISPKEIDFLNMLTVDPSTGVGQIVYEPTQDKGKEKVNRELYTLFTGGSYQMDTNSNNTLFNVSWDSGSQLFNLTGLTQSATSPKVESFFIDYYSTIELPDIEGITKSAMLLTIQGDGSDTPLFNSSLNKLNRLLQKLFAICGSPTKQNQLGNQNAVDLFNENDLDVEFYFDFNDVEGIDIDDEDARNRRVLKFRDCNNFESVVNPTMISDFVYLSTKKNLNDLVNSTLSRTATDAYMQSDSNIPEINFNLNLMNLFILNLPKALIMNVLSPKILLPIVIIYKQFKLLAGQVLESAEVLMKNLYKLFNLIISKLFWKFIREFWKLVKVDLLAFVLKIAQRILKNKYKRYVIIITSLIALLTKILEEGIDNCYDLFNAVLSAIQGALSARSPFNVPGILLGLSDSLPGYSQDRAYLNITERLEAAGISMSPIFGEGNDLPQLVKSIIDGNTEEMDTNSFIKVSNQLMTIPTPAGPIVIPPGVLNSSGKMF